MRRGGERGPGPLRNKRKGAEVQPHQYNEGRSDRQAGKGAPSEVELGEVYRYVCT